MQRQCVNRTCDHGSTNTTHYRSSNLATIVMRYIELEQFITVQLKFLLKKINPVRD